MRCTKSTNRGREKHPSLSSSGRQAQTEKGRVHGMSLIKATDGSCRVNTAALVHGVKGSVGATSEIVNITTNANTFTETRSCGGGATWHRVTFVPLPLSLDSPAHVTAQCGPSAPPRGRRVELQQRVHSRINRCNIFTGQFRAKTNSRCFSIKTQTMHFFIFKKKTIQMNYIENEEQVKNKSKSSLRSEK